MTAAPGTKRQRGRPRLQGTEEERAEARRARIRRNVQAFRRRQKSSISSKDCSQLEGQALLSKHNNRKEQVGHSLIAFTPAFVEDKTHFTAEAATIDSPDLSGGALVPWTTDYPAFPQELGTYDDDDLQFWDQRQRQICISPVSGAYRTDPFQCLPIDQTRHVSQAYDFCKSTTTTG